MHNLIHHRGKIQAESISTDLYIIWVDVLQVHIWIKSECQEYQGITEQALNTEIEEMSNHDGACFSEGLQIQVKCCHPSFNKYLLHLPFF